MKINIRNMDIKIIDLDDKNIRNEWEKRHNNENSLVYNWSLLDDYKLYNIETADAFLFFYDDKKEKCESIELTLWIPSNNFEHCVYSDTKESAIKQLLNFIVNMKTMLLGVEYLLNNKIQNN